METNRVYDIAKFLTQVSIAILPVGAGASGLIAQQVRTTNVWLSIILVWVGLVVLVISIHINLDILKTVPGDADAINKHEKKLGTSITLFIAGVVMLLLSPLSFVLQGRSPDVSMSSEEIYLQRLGAGAVKSIIVFTADQGQSVQIKSQKIVPYCVRAVNLGEEVDILTSTLYSTWEISADPSCVRGDYLLNFNIWRNNTLWKQKKLLIRISDQ